MKELTIEQKAQRYDEAIKLAKDSYNYPSYPGFIRADVVFPELKESKNWIPKEIIKYLKEKGDFRSCWIAWLEKQCEQILANSAKTCKDEQKPADNESKFHEGDWVVYDHRPYQVVELPKEGYINLGLRGNGKIEFAPSTYCRHWTIQDAKAGDVLSFNDGHGNDCVELIKSITGKKIEFWFCLTNGNRYEVFDGVIPYTNLTSREDATPATKEQHDALMKAMSDAGYTFDFEKKELKRIEEEVYGEDYGIDSLYHAQRILEKTLGKVDGYQSDDGMLEHKAAITAVKKLYEKKPTWSKEDEKEVAVLEAYIRSKDWSERHIDRALGIVDELVNKVKSFRPQNTWKPSDEQIEALDFAADCIVPAEFCIKRKVLKELLEQLKKLKGY